MLAGTSQFPSLSFGKHQSFLKVAGSEMQLMELGLATGTRKCSRRGIVTVEASVHVVEREGGIDRHQRLAGSGTWQPHCSW